MIRTRTLVVRLVLAIALFAVSGVLVLFQGTIKGLYDCKLKYWKESSFKGKPLQELRQHLQAQNQSLEWYDPTRFKIIAHRSLGSNQTVMVFLKGDSYPWFRVGSAQNAGLVVIENTTNGEIVIDLIRTIEVDAP